MLAFLTTELNAAQIKRLGQISIQMKGAEGLLESIHSRSLDLSDGQRTSLNQIVSQRAASHLVRPSRPSPFEVDLQVDELNARAQELNTALSVLDSKQKRAWQSIAGPPFQWRARPHAPLKKARGAERAACPPSPHSNDTRGKGGKKGDRGKGGNKGT